MLPFSAYTPHVFFSFFFFFFNDTATTEIYTLSLHDALPICLPSCRALGADEFVDLGTRALGAERGLHRPPPRRALAQLGHVEVAVQRERERAGDRRRRQQQHVGGVPLLDQSGALLHPEPMLLVDHDQAEA